MSHVAPTTVRCAACLDAFTMQRARQHRCAWDVRMCTQCWGWLPDVTLAIKGSKTPMCCCAQSAQEKGK